MTGTIAARLTALLQQKHMEQKKLAQAVGVTPQAVNRWVKGQSEPTSEMAVKMASVLGVTAGWLCYGDKMADRPTNGRLMIRRFDFSAVCGDSLAEQEPAGVEMIEVSESWAERHIPHFRGTLEGFSIITAEGDSMSPTWSDGSILLVDNRVDRIAHDGLYVFQYDGTTYAKRVLRVGRDLLVISDNERYPAFKIEGDRLSLVRVSGRVIKALSLVDLA